jgi:hypothetical protein
VNLIMDTMGALALGESRSGSSSSGSSRSSGSSSSRFIDGSNQLLFLIISCYITMYV